MIKAVVARDGRAPGPAGGRRRVFHRCSCGRPIPEGVSRCSARTCPEFAPIWARDTRRRLLENLRLVKLSVMFSVTAPGADVYPFDPRFCSPSPSLRRAGRTSPELLCREGQQLVARPRTASLSVPVLDACHQMPEA